MTRPAGWGDAKQVIARKQAEAKAAAAAASVPAGPRPVTPSTVVRDKQVMADRYLVTEKEQDELIAWIATLEIPSALQKVMAKACDLDRVTQAWCPRCNESAKVRYPDYNGMHKIFDLLFRYKLQKPSELRQVDITVTTKNVGEMDAGERAAYRQQLLQQVRRELPPSTT